MLSTLNLTFRNTIEIFAGRLLTLVTSTTLAVSLSVPAHADDTEVFFGQIERSDATHPNVLFVLDTSGSMTLSDSGQVGTRMDRLREAMGTILDEATNVNIGLMRMNGLEGGGAVVYPVTPVSQLICGPGDSCGETTVNTQVTAKANDSSQDKDNPNTNNTGAFFLEMGENAATGEEQITGHTFSRVLVPQGANITSARIIFTAGAESNGDANLKIFAEDVDNAESFTNDNNHLGQRFDNRANVHINWNDVEKWKQSQIYESPDISDLVQEIVDRDNWCGGNDLAMFITGDGTRNAFSYDAGPNAGAKLAVTYDGASIPSDGGCIEKTVTVQVSQNIDDALELLDPNSSTFNNRMFRHSTSLHTPRVSTSDTRETITGLYFADIPIPQGAEVKSANLQLTIADAQSGDAEVAIRVQDSANPAEIGGNRRSLSNRTLLPGAVDWAFPDSSNTPPGAKIRSGNFGSLIDNVVGKGNWDLENNAILVLMQAKPGNGTRLFRTHDSEPSSSAKLEITYNEKIGETRLIAKDELREVVANLEATGGTPITSAYLEAANYYLGNDVDYGRTRGNENVPAIWWAPDRRSRFHRVSHPDSYVGNAATRPSGCTDDFLSDSDCKNEEIFGPAVYKSPIETSCQSNHIVFLSDGEPTSNTAADKIRSLTGDTRCAGSGNEECATELANWLHNTDHVSSLANDQNISTYTIGFNLELDFLEDIAAAGGGRYFQASSANELTRVFDDILADVLSVDTSFVAPGATVNQFNRLTHDKNIYFALFQPNERPTWEGNIKRFQVQTIDGETNIVDKNLQVAIDEDSGFFKTQSQSFWSNTSDGHAIEAGGAAGQITLNYAYVPDNTLRRTYTFTGDSSSLYGNTTTANLRDPQHRLNEDNNLITDEMLNIHNFGAPGAAREAYRESLLQWTRGVDILDEDQDGVHDEARRHMGDPMHSRPVIVNYERVATGAAGGNTVPGASQQQPAHTTIFVSTNEGYLHAIDQETGEELYSFMPQELLRNLFTNFENVSSASRPYGLDGSLSVFTNDTNNNVVVDGQEKAFLYVGMRRGGNNIYALDITDRHEPKLAWVIRGGDNGTPGFENLGQTWSRLVPHTIFHNGTPKNVLTFTAGYDENQDPKENDPPRSTDDSGRGLFMIDAETGSIIWSGGGVAGLYDTHFPDMDYSIPSTPRIIDVDADGYSDQIWVGDMGGNLWRFDLTKYHTTGEFVRGGIMADFSDSTTANERRFFAEPDTAIVSYNGRRHLTIGIGSGWRAHPLDTDVDDRYYLLRTTDIIEAPEGYGKYVAATNSYTPLREADLDNATDVLAVSTNPYGWYIELERNGEKVLGGSVTLNNKIIFTTYVPELTGNDCSPAVGEAYVYAIDVFGGQPVTKVEDENGDIVDPEKEHRSRKLNRGGLPPEATVLLTEAAPPPADGSTPQHAGECGGNGSPLVLIGTEKFCLDTGLETKRTFWLDKSKAGRTQAESSVIP